MPRLAPEIVEAIVIEHGRRAFLERLSEPGGSRRLVRARVRNTLT
jgi:hypothetical protein